MTDEKKHHFRLEDYDYDLPTELIAQHPAAARELSAPAGPGPRLGRTPHSPLR